MTKFCRRLICILGLISLPTVTNAVSNDSATNKKILKIEFKRTLEFSDKSHKVDDGKFVNFKCDGPRRVVASIVLDSHITANISCTSEFTEGGAVQLEYTEQDVKNVYVLSGKSGDAGDRGDTRSRISRDALNNLILQTTTVTSSEQIDGENIPVVCNERRSSLVWSTEAKGFKNRQPLKELIATEFQSPLFVNKTCIKDGNFFSKEKVSTEY